MSKFQIITLALFVLFILVGVAAFATYKGKDASTALPAINVWGTFPADSFNQYVSSINNTLEQSITVKYTQISSDTFSQEFIAALARGTGPDAILIPADMLLPHEDKLALIPYSALSQRSFLDMYVSEASVYNAPNGILALPFTLDPLVMYWNRDMFDAAGIATYPKFWDEFAPLTKKLTVKDQNGNVRKSAVALGSFSNVINAREIFGAFLLQLGNPITIQNNDGTALSTIKVAAAASPLPALQFFTQFSDPAQESYSWNRGLTDSKSAFLSGILATYFGFASELPDLRAKNPNINFDVASLPQIRTGGVKATYGRMYGLSIVRSAPNPNAVYQIFSILTAPQNLTALSQKLYLPTVRRDAMVEAGNDPYVSIFNQAALISKTWLDVDPARSGAIFSRMVDAFTSGQKTSYEAIQDAGAEYDVLLSQAQQ